MTTVTEEAAIASDCSHASDVLADVLRKNTSADSVRRFNNKAMMGQPWAGDNCAFYAANAANATLLRLGRVAGAEAAAQTVWTTVRGLCRGDGRAGHPAFNGFDYGDGWVFDPSNHGVWIEIVAVALGRVGYDESAVGLLATRLAQLHPYSPNWAWGRPKTHYGSRPPANPPGWVYKRDGVNRWEAFAI